MPSFPYPHIASIECPCCLNPALLPNHLDIPKRINIPLTFIHRLEAATSRLEDMIPTETARNGMSSLPEAGLTAPRPNDQNAPTSSQTQLAVAPLPPAIDDFDALINADVKTFVNMSEEIGGLVAEQVSTETKEYWGQPCNTSRWLKMVVVSRSTSSLRCGTEVFDRYHEGEETRHSITCIHGNSKRPTVDYGCRK